MSDESTPHVRVTPVPWVIWRELTYVMHDGSRRPHACVRGWATNEHLAGKLLEHLEEANPEHSYHMGTCDQWGPELRMVRELLERGVKDGGRLIPRTPTMAELRLELAEKCCPACDVPALVMCARRLELLEEPGSGGMGCARAALDSDAMDAEAADVDRAFEDALARLRRGATS